MVPSRLPALTDVWATYLAYRGAQRHTTARSARNEIAIQVQIRRDAFRLGGAASVVAAASIDAMSPRATPLIALLPAYPLPARWPPQARMSTKGAIAPCSPCAHPML